MEISRYEINRQVRTVLIRHDINLSLIDYSYLGSTVYLTGEILSSSNEELTLSAIEALISEITRLQGVRDIQFDLENWSVSSSGFSWQCTKKKKMVPVSSADVSQAGDVTIAGDSVYIEKSEEIKDVLKDLKNEESTKK